jgi:putative endonuclease
MKVSAASVPCAYLVRCSDGTLYAGSTPDLGKRLHEHNYLKSGARYTKARRPVEIAHAEYFRTISEARKRECELKKLSRAEKLSLLQSHANEKPNIGRKRHNTLRDIG